jgi:hypothetical protein
MFPLDIETLGLLAIMCGDVVALMRDSMRKTKLGVKISEHFFPLSIFQLQINN